MPFTHINLSLLTLVCRVKTAFALRKNNAPINVKLAGGEARHRAGILIDRFGPGGGVGHLNYRACDHTSFPGVGNFSYI